MRKFIFSNKRNTHLRHSYILEENILFSFCFIFLSSCWSAATIIHNFWCFSRARTYHDISSRYFSCGCLRSSRHFCQPFVDLSTDKAWHWTVARYCSRHFSQEGCKFGLFFCIDRLAWCNPFSLLLLSYWLFTCWWSRILFYHFGYIIIYVLFMIII